jgi:hypothetical protein
VLVLDRVLCFEKSVLFFFSLGCSRTDLKEWNSKKKAAEDFGSLIL